MGRRIRPKPFLVRCGEGFPLIVVHGNGVDHRLLLPLGEVFDATGGWERIYVDLPGFWRTPPLPGTGGVPKLATWLLAAIGEIVGDRPFALLAPVVDPDPAKRTVPEFAVMERDEVLASLDIDNRDE